MKSFGSVVTVAGLYSRPERHRSPPSMASSTVAAKSCIGYQAVGCKIFGEQLFFSQVIA